jgi:hypothetical protein
MIKALDSPESLENFYQTTRCHSPEEDKYCYVHVCDYRRVLEWMIGFIALIHSTCDPSAQLSEARTVFPRSNTGIVGSNPARGIDVFLRVFYVCTVLCEGIGFRTC